MHPRLWGPLDSSVDAGCGKMTELKVRIETDEWIYEECVEA